MASEVLISISKDEEERFRLMSELKYELDLQSKMTYAKQQGRHEGRQEGKQEIIDLLKSGKSAEEIIRDYSNK